MSHLILLIGLPGSGKSTIAQALVQQCPDRHIISTDAIRAQLFGDERIQGSWLKIEQEIVHQFQQTIQHIQDGIVSEVIYDATHAVRKHRRAAIVLAQTCGFTHITALWVKTPLWLCLMQNQKRDRQVPEAVILHMHRCLTGASPSLEEGFDRLIQLQPGFNPGLVTLPPTKPFTH